MGKVSILTNKKQSVLILRWKGGYQTNKRHMPACGAGTHSCFECQSFFLTASYTQLGTLSPFHTKKGEKLKILENELALVGIMLVVDSAWNLFFFLNLPLQMSVFLDLVFILTRLTNRMKRGAVLKSTATRITNRELQTFNTTDFMYLQSRKLLITDVGVLSLQSEVSPT